MVSDNAHVGSAKLRLSHKLIKLDPDIYRHPQNKKILYSHVQHPKKYKPPLTDDIVIEKSHVHTTLLG